MTDEAKKDLQRGKLAHVCKGGVGQRADLIVAQVTVRNVKKKKRK